MNRTSRRSSAQRGSLADIVFVEPLHEHVLRLGFDDGYEGTVDVAQVIGSFRGVFRPLKRVSYFRRVRVDADLGTVCWPNGADIAPETLREELQDVKPVRKLRRLASSVKPPAPGRNGSMPEICRFLGIVIQMYYRENLAPHSWARYARRKASIDIETLGVSSGSLPPRVLGFVAEWAALHRDELEKNWDRARRGRQLRPIAPLE